MDATADADGFIVAYPQALIPDGTGFDWNVPGEPLVGGRHGPGERAERRGVPHAIGREPLRTATASTLHRVFATGFSGGARTASQLACDASSHVRRGGTGQRPAASDSCPATRAVPVVAFHGTADPVDPYDGNGQSYWTYSVPQAAADWAAQDGCSPTPTTTQPDPGVTLTAYAGCRERRERRALHHHGGRSRVARRPAPAPRDHQVLGPQSTAIDANSVMWAFFEAHPMP